jgi:predicted peroxiredoxin
MDKGLALIVSTADEQRFWSALSLAAAKAALGVEVAIFLSGHAARLAAPDYISGLALAHHAKGVATIADLLSSCLELGVSFAICQTGMHLCEVHADQLAHHHVPTGLVAWLAAHREHNLIFV